MPDYIKTADLHAALARVRDETKAAVWKEAYAAGQKAEQEQYAKAIQLVTLGRALGGFPVTSQAVVTQPVTPDPVEEIIRETKAFAENPALPRRENPDGPAYGKLLQLTEGWVHPDGAVTVLHSPAEAHVAALAEADPGVSQAFHASLARHAHRKHPGEFVDDDVKDYAFDKGFIHLTGRGRTIEATGKHEMLLKHRKFLKELAMRATTLVFRPVDGDDYEVKAKREGKAIPANPRHRTADVLGTHAVVQDALSRGDTQYANRQREIHADALDDAGAVREAALERVLAGQQPASHLAATFKNAANLKRAARSRTEAAHTATEAAYEGTLSLETGGDDEYRVEHAHHAFDRSHDARGWSRLGEFGDSRRFGELAASHHTRAATDAAAEDYNNTAALHRHAAEQHRVAAAYNAAAHHADTQRTVKAQDFEEGASVAHMPAAKFTPEQMTDIHRYNSHMSDHMDEHGQIHQLYGEETPGLRTQEQYLTSGKLLEESDRLGHAEHVRRYHPNFDPHHANEMMLDAADTGDEPGHRYWQNRLADTHLLLQEAAEKEGHDALRNAHRDAYRKMSGNYFPSSETAHAILAHNGDVGAAAKAATKIALDMTKPGSMVYTKRGKEHAVLFRPMSHADTAAAHSEAATAIDMQPYEYRPLTREDIDNRLARTAYHAIFSKGPDGTMVHHKVNGQLQTWKTRPGEFRLPTKTGGMYSPGSEITHANLHEFYTIDEAPEAARRAAREAHSTAAALHREAATGDHTAREIKAVRWNQARAEQHEPHVTDGNYAGGYDEDDAGSEPVHSAYYRSNALLDKSGDAGHVDKLADRYPHLNPWQVNENMLDAADMGDEAGHRYWKRRLGDVHLMLAGEAHAAKDTDLAAEHDKFATHLYGKSGNQLDEEHEAAAHLIAHHKGDVAAAARHASEAAIGATDPELVKNVATKGPTNSNVSGPHYDAYHYHLDAVRSISHAPDTYRPATRADVDAALDGQRSVRFHSTEISPSTGRELPYSGLALPAGPSASVRGDDRTPFDLHLHTAGGIEHITPRNIHDYTVIDTDARQHRSDVQQMHEVAALLHREAATGDHEKREIKAERKAFAPGIEAEPGAAGRTLHPPPDAGMRHYDDTEGALHAAMVSRPHDMTPRMILADYYDDHDQPHTAALHRFVAEPTRSNFDMLAAFHEHPSEVAHTVEHAAAMHADATIPRWVAVDRGVDYEDERRHPATGAIPPTGLRNELNNVIHRNAYHPSVQRFPADSPNRTERRLTRDSLMWHHQRYGEEQANFAAAHADPSTVADWGPDPISEQDHAFARTLHHAASEAHRHARDYLTEQDALDKPTTNDGPIPEGVWRHPRLGREGKAIADPAPHGYCPDCKGVNSDEKTCPTCGAFDKNPKYSYVGVELTGEMADYLHSAGAMIPDADLAKDGRETNPHVTVRYGLHENDGAGTHEVLTGAGPVTVRFASELAMFSNKDADVIHVPVRSGGLRRLNGMLAALPHTDTHDGYKPHATIAYVKPGLGAKYIKELPAPPATRDTIGTVTFSNPAKTTRVINLEAE